MGNWLESLIKIHEDNLRKERARSKEIEREQKELKVKKVREEILAKQQEQGRKYTKMQELHSFLERIGGQSLLVDIKKKWPRGKMIEVASDEFYTAGLDIDTLTIGFIFTRKYSYEASRWSGGNDGGYLGEFTNYAACIEGIGICAKHLSSWRPGERPQVYFKSGTLIEGLRLDKKVKEETIKKAKFRLAHLNGIKIEGESDSQLTDGLKQELGKDIMGRLRYEGLPNFWNNEIPHL